MRCFQADWVYPVSSSPLENGQVLTDEEGFILGVFPAGENSQIPADILPEKMPGILIPGFVNVHCHLELSWMKGKIPPNEGLDGFVRQFVALRASCSEEERIAAIEAGEEEMFRGGIVAVGDISNGSGTFAIKSRHLLRYHTFLEVFDLNPARADSVFSEALGMEQGFRNQLPANKEESVSPHSPYTVSPALHTLLSAHALKENSFLSIHNQETLAEDELFKSGKGKLQEMYKGMGLEYSWFKPTGNSSLQSTLKYYSAIRKLLLVHNTFTTEADMKWAKEFQSSQKGPELFWVTCPNANLYIENQPPDYNAMLRQGLKVAVGTDSLASNYSLSILDELITISLRHPQIPLETLFCWACLNGAESLDLDQELGSLEKGKRPGLVLITNVVSGRLQKESKATRII